MTNAARKFDFDTVFSSEGEIVRSSTATKTLFTKSELQDAHDQGYAAGETSARAEADRATAANVAQLFESLTDLHANLSAESASLKRDAVDLALTAARVLASRALAQHPECAAMGMLEEACGHLRDHPHITLTTPPETIDDVRAAVQSAAERLGLSQTVTIKPGAPGANGAAALSWSGGEITNDPGRTIAALREAATRWLNAHTGNDAATGDQFNLFDSLDG